MYQAQSVFFCSPIICRWELPTCRSWKTGLEFWKWRPYRVRSLVSNSIYAKKDRNGPPSANQGASKDEPRHGHAVGTLQPTHLPLSRPFCWHNWRKWHHEAESIMMLKALWALMGRQIVLKWSYLMIFMRVLVAVSVKWCKVYAWKQKWLCLVSIGTNDMQSHPPTYTCR